MKCTGCNEEFSNDELVGYDCNGDSVSTDELSLERNAHNPDYCVSLLCGECEEARVD